MIGGQKAPMDLYETIGQRIKEEREKRGLSQETLAAKLGLAANTISRWETATYKPRVHELDRLASELKISILDLLPPQDGELGEPMQSLLRAAKDLTPKDIETLTRFAEFRAADYRMRNRPTRGRKG
jgi:transcriptional regulator with XRE-family HTH domain